MALKLDEIALFKKAQTGDEESLNLIISSNMRLVYKLVHRYKSKVVEKEELISCGMMGLLKAIQQFDFSYETQFSTYAVPLILGEIRRFFRDDGAIRVSRSIKELYLKVEKAREELESSLNRPVKLDEIANHLEVSYEDVITALDAHYYPTSLETPLDEDNLTLSDTLGIEETNKQMEYMDLENAMKLLEPKEQLFIRMRFFEDLKQAEIAERLFISQVQVSRLEKKILEKLRANLV